MDAKEKMFMEMFPYDEYKLDFYNEDRTLKDSFWSAGEYSQLLNHLPYDILVQVDEDAYQGDSYVLFKDPTNEETYGVLIFGWGSCSGCDALQGAENYKEVIDIYEGMERDIKWFSGEDASIQIMDYLAGDAAEGRWHYNEDPSKEFTKRVGGYFNTKHKEGEE